MTPRIVWKLFAIVPFVLALALVGCGDGDSGTTPSGGDIIDTPDEPEADTVPPGIPTNPTAVPLDDSIVVQWDENSEPDLAGYVLERSVDSGQEWVVVTAALITEATFTDTLRGNVMYRVLAEDTSRNQSAPSATAHYVHATGGGGKDHSNPDEPQY
jgi:hypothetical protein